MSNSSIAEDIPLQCGIIVAPSLDDTRAIFLSFTILWVILNVFNIFRAGGLFLYRDSVYILLVLAFLALAVVLWAVTYPDHKCEGSVATCATISCVCGNLIWQGAQIFGVMFLLTIIVWYTAVGTGSISFHGFKGCVWLLHSALFVVASYT